MNIKYTSLHQVDHHLNKVAEIDLNNQSEDLKNYTKRLFTEITESQNKRSFEFKSETTEVRVAIVKFIDEHYAEASIINANRLLDIEFEAQKRIDHLNITIQKGSLFQAILSEDNNTYVIISKADHNQFLDEVDFELKNGLPYDKKTFKAFLVKLDRNQTPTDIFVYDTTNRMARYWWDSYLELKEKYTDRHNTKTSLDILDKKVFNKIKKDYPADHTIIRNSAIGYFRNNEEFELEEFVNQTLKNYNSIHPDFPKENTIEKVQALPEKWKFDARFTIEKEEINKRKSNKILLTDNIELILKDHIGNLANVIEAEKDAEGVKYIKIKTDIGYERFKRNI